MKKFPLILLVLVAFWVSKFANAQDDSLEANLSKLLPSNMTIQAIQETPMNGVYEVMAGNQTLYVYSEGEFLMIGDVYDTDRKVNLGEEKKNSRIAEALKSIPESEMVMMGEKSERYVTVFTDTDCGYCQRFHRTIPELNAKGMQVRYLAFPRAGLNSASYHEAVSVWCADDQAEAMTIAKSGGRVESKVCENPVAQQYQLGQQIGIRGTPTMVLDSGKVIPGFLPPAQLLAEAGMSDN